MATAKRTAVSPDRLLDNIKRTESGCWEWLGRIDKDGYGLSGGRRVHRVMYVMFCGPINGKRCVCHTCDNPRCCNPTHLFLGSDLDNARDRAEKHRGASGDRHGIAKLTAERVAVLRRDLAAGMGLKMAARKYRVNRSTIQAIAKGRTWRGVK
jgi:hypothetical protein